MSNNHFDPGNVLKDSFNEELKALNVVGVSSIIKLPWTYISASYPDSVTENYKYYDTIGGTLVAAVIIVYTTNAKINISTVQIIQ